MISSRFFNASYQIKTTSRFIHELTKYMYHKNFVYFLLLKITFNIFFSNTLQTRNTNLSIKQCLKTFQVLNKENGNNDLRYFTHIPIKHLINFFKKLNIYFTHPTFPSMHFYCVKLRR